MTNLTLSRNEIEEEFDQDVADGIVWGAMFGMVILMMPLLVQQLQAQTRVPALSEGIEPVAGNVGLMWIQITPVGYPNQLRMIAENSTGAFESMLLGLTT